MTALGLMWRFGDPSIGRGPLGGVEVQRAALVQRIEALAMAEFPDGDLPVVAMPASGADRVIGSFVVGGKTTSFSSVAAFWEQDWRDKSKWDLFVLVSDVPVPANAVPKDDDGISKMAALVREDKVHALELDL